MLQHFEIDHFRIIDHAEFTPSSGLTIIVGENASGKTSLLEAINLAFTGRSFRTHRIDQIISQNYTSFQLVAQFTDDNQHIHTLGCERKDKKLRIRYNGQAIAALSQLAAQVPVHLIQPETHHLLEQGPKFRRQFIDWGVFHVEPGYLPLWKTYHRTLRQRNSLLRRGAPSAQVQAWDAPLVEQASELHQCRQRYLALLCAQFVQTCSEIMDQEPKIQYYCGWDDTLPLAEILKKNIKMDLEHGFTQAGCHRADLILRVEGRTPQQYYSRGQQKLLISALRIAHYLVLKLLAKPTGILLVDDLPAELDSNRRRQFLHTVAKSQIQTMITATEIEQLKVDMWPSQKVFHVEHGVLREVV
jgi:DNA replication and repair protein RecF